MNKTKKNTILFVVLCFVVIGGIGIFNAYFPQTKQKEVTQEEVKETESIQKEEPQDTKTDESSSQETSQKETKPKRSSQSEMTKKETREKTNQTTEKPKEKIQEKDIVEEKKEYVNLTITGMDSVIFNEEVIIENNQSVYEVLKTATNKKGMELKTNGFGPTIYIVGINGLNEFDNGPQSGWKYKVNHQFPSQSAGSYKVKDGDQIEWIYTTNG